MNNHQPMKIRKKMYDRIQSRKKIQKFGDALIYTNCTILAQPVEIETLRKKRLIRKQQSDIERLPKAVGVWKITEKSFDSKDEMNPKNNLFVPSFLSKDSEKTNIRITNLPESTTDQDLNDLVRPFGNISRTFLGKCKETNNALGYAFVDFCDKASAEKAIKKLNGFGYGHLILAAEWAKQKNK